VKNKNNMSIPDVLAEKTKSGAKSGAKNILIFFHFFATSTGFIPEYKTFCI